MLRTGKKAFGNRVRRRREALELSQEKLAALVGMKQQGIVSIESGAVERPRKLKELADALHTSDDWLLYETGDEVVTPSGRIAGASTVPIVGYLGAGGQVEPVPDHIPRAVDIAFAAPEGLVAIVAGDMAGLRYEEGEVILIREKHGRKVHEFYDELALVRTKDGSRFLCRIVPGLRGGLDLVDVGMHRIQNVEIESIGEIYRPVPRIRLEDRTSPSRRDRSRDRRRASV